MGDGQVVEWLQRIDARLARLEQRFERAALSRADRKRLEALLPVWAGVFGSECKKAADIIGSDHPGLRLVHEGLSVKALGKLLARAEGHDIGGFVVARANADNGSTFWAVEKVISKGFETPGASLCRLP